MNSPSSQQPDARLLRLLGGAPLTALRQRLRRHFERHGGRVGHALRLTHLTAEELDALSLLTGRTPRAARSMRIDIEQLDAALSNAGIAPSLRGALEMLDGPIENRAASRLARQARWAQLVAKQWHPRIRAWLQTPNGNGLLKRLAGGDPDTAEELMTGADAVMQRLPTAGMPRAQLAAEALGDSHALDNGEPIATMILSALKHERLEGDTAERGRDAWARVGVLVNELARPALCLNLPSSEPNAHERCEPRYLSLRQLVRSKIEWNVAGRHVYVCENPNFVAIAADHLGARCAPLVCTDGMPAAAQRMLLIQLVAAGATLRYHGDFDWAGIRIANFVMRTWPATAWRFGVVEYQTAISSAARSRRNLRGPAAVAAWDPTLTTTMLERGIAISEEAVAGSLLADLDRSSE